MQAKKFQKNIECGLRNLEFGRCSGQSEQGKTALAKLIFGKEFKDLNPAMFVVRSKVLRP
jgi:hypothetical protein